MNSFVKPKNLLNPFKRPFTHKIGGALAAPNSEARVGLSPLTLPMEGLPRVVNYTADGGGCAFYRMIWPMEYMISTNRAVVMNMYQMVLNPWFYKGIEAVVLQRQCGDHQVTFIKELKKYQEFLRKESSDGKVFKMIFEIDDIVCPASCINDYNRCKEAFQGDKISNNMKEIMPLMDEFLVPSKTMRDHYKQYLNFDKITVIPDYLPPSIYDRWYDEDLLIENYEDHKKRPRILYAGSGTHFDIANRNNQIDDFSHLNDFIIENRYKYKFVFLGGFPLKLRPYVQNGEMEFHQWVDLFDLPKKMIELRPQVVIAPLLDNIFNASKANIKVTEAGSLGIPAVVQDLPCYEEALFKFKTAEDFKNSLEKALDKDTYLDNIRASRELAEKYFIDKHLDEYSLVYTTPYGDPKRLENKWFTQNNN